MECEKKQYQLQAVCFAASTGVVIACLEGTFLKSFMEKLRVWMFLALNLLLLAILLTSTNPTLLSGENVQKQNNASEKKLKVSEREDEEKDCKVEMVTIEDKENQENYKNEDVVESKLMVQEEVEEKVIECDLKGQESCETEMKEEDFQLSKEELNEKVEAFIAMFKQHLRSDAKGRSCRQFHSSLSKNSRRLNVMPKHFR